MEGLMNIEALSPGQSGYNRTSAMINGAEKIQRNRDAAEKSQATGKSSGKEGQANEVQPEELLQSIKALTDQGAYSVRFEMHKETNELVINLVDQQSGEVVRQIPSDEILGMHKMLSDLSGNLLQTKS
jgi:flagellar protein FlaG